MFWRRLALLAVLATGLSVAAEAQFRRDFFGARIATPEDFDGRFHFCRMVYQSARFRGRGGSWTTDYPRADINMSIRLAELARGRT